MTANHTERLSEMEAGVMPTATLFGLFGLVIPAASIACVDTPPEPAERTGAVSQAVSGGELDVTNLYPNVVYIEGPTWQCSGFLATPTHIVTANHCITGGISEADQECSGPYGPGTKPDDSGESFEVSFDRTPVLPLDPSDPSYVLHTLTRSGAVVVRKHAEISACTSDEAAIDVAVIQLDRRVTNSWVAPLHPAGLGGNGGCSAGEATFVGYGPTAELFPTHDDKRTYALSAGWSLEEIVPGSESIWTNSWVAAPASTALWYFGGLPGDSGGPIIQGGVACGVMSRYAPYYVPPAWFGYFSDFAALDSPANIAFLSAQLFDSKGRFKGECDEVPSRVAMSTTTTT
ncbi:MAG: hypothetical protein HY908_17375 [Myxococcales bacterium]|nr:hypothetical protein [Myxococcales bacterium]